MGNFIRWVVADILREEADTMEVSNLTTLDVTKSISAKAREWYFNMVYTK